MEQLERTQEIRTDRAHSELHFAIGGFWTLETMRAFLDELAKAAIPFIKARETFSALGDLRHFVPQDRETADAIRQSLLLAQTNGLTRFAVVSESSLVRMQYRRITSGLDVEFFDMPSEAEQWLRTASAA